MATSRATSGRHSTTLLFSDLTTAWGRDRRGSGGAWFEIAQPTRRPVPPGPASDSREASEAGLEGG